MPRVEQPRFKCPRCWSTAVRPILVTARTVELLCDDCDHEWSVGKAEPDPPQSKR